MGHQTYIVPQRPPRRPLEFEGHIIADVSSATPGKTDWQEIRIYETQDHIFVTEVIRNSNRPDAEILRTVRTYSNPAEVRKGLYRNQDGRKFMTKLGREALKIAAGVVPAIATIDPDLETVRIENLYEPADD